MENNRIFAIESGLLDNFLTNDFPPITVLRENKLTGIPTCIGVGKLDYILHEGKKIWFVHKGCSFTYERIKCISFSPENGTEITLKAKYLLDSKGD